jgi:hypothetical protein
VVKKDAQSSQRDGIDSGGSITSLLGEAKVQEIVLPEGAVSRVRVKDPGFSTSNADTGNVHEMQSKLR